MVHGYTTVFAGRVFSDKATVPSGKMVIYCKIDSVGLEASISKDHSTTSNLDCPIAIVTV